MIYQSLLDDIKEIDLSSIPQDRPDDTPIQPVKRQRKIETKRYITVNPGEASTFWSGEFPGVAIMKMEVIVEKKLKRSRNVLWELLNDIDLDRGWYNVLSKLEDELMYVTDEIDKRLGRDGELCPHKDDIFRALQLCPLDRVKVLIMGQDPYHTPGAADGLAFSTRSSRIQPSLTNIFNEIKRSIKGFKIPKHGDLTAWEEQGVLLLNACLTVTAGKAESHYISKGKNKLSIWSGFMEIILEAISKSNRGLIVLLWGENARNMKKYLKSTSPDNILESSHPSPFSYNKTNAPFAGNNHFKLVNEMLEDRGEEPIDWQI